MSCRTAVLVPPRDVFPAIQHQPCSATFPHHELLAQVLFDLPLLPQPLCATPRYCPIHNTTGSFTFALTVRHLRESRPSARHPRPHCCPITPWTRHKHFTDNWASHQPLSHVVPAQAQLFCFRLSSHGGITRLCRWLLTEVLRLSLSTQD